MYVPSLSYDEHAMIYSADLVVVFRMMSGSAPALSVQLCTSMYRPLIVYCTGLCLLRKHQTCRGMAQRVGGASHDALTRLLNHGPSFVAIVMMHCVQTALQLSSGWMGPCWLILDDVILPKPYAKQMFAAYFDYDHVADRPVRCLRVVVLCWTNGWIKVPVAFALWHKRGGAYLEETGHKFRTKNQLARILVWQVHRRGLPFDYVVFDSWYTSAENLIAFHRWGLAFVGALKSNRTLRQIAFPLDEAPKTKKKNRTHPLWKEMSATQWAGQYPHSRDYHRYDQIACRARRWCVFVKDVDFVLTLVCIKNYAKTKTFKKMLTPADKKAKDPNKYLVTNRCERTTVQIIQRYQNRWAVECLFRDCKQHLGLCAYQGQSVDAHQRHIACVFFAYVMMELLKDQTQPIPPKAHTLSIGDVKTWLERQYLLVAAPEKPQAIHRVVTIPDPHRWKTWMETPALVSETTGRPLAHQQTAEFNELKKSA